jgi:hypothetical protein
MPRNAMIEPEECARRILQRELGRPVVLNDDGRRQHMYDLRVGLETRPDIAIECVGAVDSQRTETWNIGPGRGSFTIPLDGDWNVVLRPDANVKRIRAELLGFLQECRNSGLEGYTHVDAFLHVRNPSLFEHLRRLRIDSIGCYHPGTGRVFLGMTGLGGAVDPTGKEVPKWIGTFLRAADREDVLLKLSQSGAAECHVFVPVSFGGVPWLVESYLGTETELLPAESPDLPTPVDAVWLTYGRKGLRWDGDVWRFFDPVVPALRE